MGGGVHVQTLAATSDAVNVTTRESSRGPLDVDRGDHVELLYCLRARSAQKGGGFQENPESLPPFLRLGVLDDS